MALSTGTRVFGSAKKLHTGFGQLTSYLISHKEAAAQTVTFYDNTTANGTMIHRVHVAPEQSPVFVRFGKEDGIVFSTGLMVDPGNCDVAVWSVSY